MTNVATPAGHICLRPGSLKAVSMTFVKGFFTVGGLAFCLFFEKPAPEWLYSEEFEARFVGDRSQYSEAMQEALAQVEAEDREEYFEDNGCHGYYSVVTGALFFLGIAKALTVPKKLLTLASELNNESLFEGTNRKRVAMLTKHLYLFIQETAITMPYDRYYSMVMGTEGFYCPEETEFGKKMSYYFAPVFAFFMAIFAMSTWMVVATNGMCGLCCTCPGWKQELHDRVRAQANMQVHHNDVFGSAAKGVQGCSCSGCMIFTTVVVIFCSLLESVSPFFSLPSLSSEEIVPTLVSNLFYLLFPFNVMRFSELSKLSGTQILSLVLTTLGNLLSFALLFLSFRGRNKDTNSQVRCPACSAQNGPAQEGTELVCTACQAHFVVGNSEKAPQGEQIGQPQQDVMPEGEQVGQPRQEETTEV
eukprot:TRINITY_DN44897_c0_g1_i1.p1 TRINITY_DN44897_c0_g1~~TRINITY_DN44897_c0_g1_i1.p1  ORF type:complete len:418 (+),score=74.82 TRINITY_DN44897_c0_g1_i1:75-1328(+)